MSHNIDFATLYLGFHHDNSIIRPFRNPPLSPLLSLLWLSLFCFLTYFSLLSLLFILFLGIDRHHKTIFTFFRIFVFLIPLQNPNKNRTETTLTPPPVSHPPDQFSLLPRFYPRFHPAAQFLRSKFPFSKVLPPPPQLSHPKLIKLILYSYL